ncbi:uncharacterized protein LOC124641722 [Helicoverpa zea]|uniref:uncharacterized protein LOC124641722 n=1 Tax=Helicoverpa zea TaxID=7113 RepID=UPI001F5AD781|nr:uncharacterized protein LOC124641722 [Helicoverpa zea]
MILNVILLLNILNLSRCSKVIDADIQSTVVVSNYCPAMKGCREGTHVMCTYYDHEHPVGEHCHEYVRFTITPQMVYQILEEVNYIRLKVATGKEVGKNDLPLPRAYGMMKMHWDGELATFAQVLADQCLGLKEDQCRATENFPNPSQVITLTNFKAPNWDYLTRNTTTQGLTKEKISFAIERALKSMHAVKKMVDPSVIYDCPAMEKLPDLSSRSYLKLIRGKATHIGCGMSAYTRYQILHNGAENMYNSVQIVCNISDGPQRSQSLYTTDPPIPGTGFTEHCGCPPGYQETEGCLCEPKPKDTSKIAEVNRVKWEPNDDNENQIGPQSEVPACTESIGDQTPKVLVLPIFHVQDYPKGTYKPDTEVEARFHQRYGNMTFMPSDSSVETNEIQVSEDKYEKKPEPLKIRTNNTSHIIRRNMPRKKNKKKFFKLKRKGVVPTKKPVKLVARTDKYDASANSFEDNDVFDHSPHVTKPNRTKPGSNFENNHIEDVVNKDNDTSFLKLLNSLERKIQDVELEGTERELFDVKMRKIYEAVLKTKIRIPTTTVGATQRIRLKKTSTHRTSIKPMTFAPADIVSDLHDESENFKLTSGVPFEDIRRSFERRIAEDNEQDHQQSTTVTVNYLPDKESDEFFKIENKKVTNLFNNRANRGSFNYFSNKRGDLSHFNVDRLYDKLHSHKKLARKQEDIDNYYQTKEKIVQDYNNHYNFRTHNERSYGRSKKDDEEHTKTLGAGIKKPAFEVKQAMKNVRKSYPSNVFVWKAPAFGYRPVHEQFQNDQEKPMTNLDHLYGRATA